jgi:hypothetical protein
VVSRTGRVVRNGAAGTVAAIAAVSSYDHMRSLALANGQAAAIATILPASVDGLVIVAAATMAADRADGRPVRRSAVLAFVVGVLASLGANVAAAPPGTLARVISAWPAAALLMTTELLVRTGRTRTGGAPACPFCDSSRSREEVVTMSRLPSRSSTSRTARTGRADEPVIPSGNLPEGKPSEPLETLAAAVAAELVGAGVPVTRDRLAGLMRDRGVRVSTERAGQLVRTVRAAAVP